jgi:hypothetical protein
LGITGSFQSLNGCLPGPNSVYNISACAIHARLSSILRGYSMKLIQAILAVTCMLFAVNGFAGKKEKVLICHVSADDGTIELINVSKNSKHLGNKAHTFAGISDYEPSEIGASGEGTEDSNGDGIDDGCEPQQACPCWAESELQSVTAENMDPTISCTAGSVIPGFAVLANLPGTTPGVEGGFIAMDAVFGGGSPRCLTLDFNPAGMVIEEDEASACIAQIAARCAAIGDPIAN